jgi:hypothetical protein
MCHKHPQLEVQGNQLFLIDHPKAIQSIPFFPQHFARDLGRQRRVGFSLAMGLKHRWLQLTLLVSLANAGWPETINLAGMQRTLSQMSHGKDLIGLGTPRTRVRYVGCKTAKPT